MFFSKSLMHSFKRMEVWIPAGTVCTVGHPHGGLSAAEYESL